MLYNINIIRLHTGARVTVVIFNYSFILVVIYAQWLYILSGYTSSVVIHPRWLYILHIILCYLSNCRVSSVRQAPVARGLSFRLRLLICNIHVTFICHSCDIRVSFVLHSSRDIHMPFE